MGIFKDIFTFNPEDGKDAQRIIDDVSEELKVNGDISELETYNPEEDNKIEKEVK